MERSSLPLLTGIFKSLFVQHKLEIWRRRRDSNPRYGFPYDALAKRWFQPLTHVSGCGVPGAIASGGRAINRAHRGIAVHCGVRRGAAKLARMTSVEKTPMKRFQLMQRVNPEGLYGAVQACLPHFYKNGEDGKGRGRIVVISPPIYRRFLRGKTAYAMGKAS